jgi:hypothetical protein
MKFIQHQHFYLSLVTGLDVTQNISTAESPDRYMQAGDVSNFKVGSSIHRIWQRTLYYSKLKHCLSFRH